MSIDAMDTHTPVIRVVPVGEYGNSEGLKRQSFFGPLGCVKMGLHPLAVGNEGLYLCSCCLCCGKLRFDRIK